MVGGGDGYMNKAYSTACILLHHMNCRTIHELVSSHHTNEIPAADDKKTIQGIESIISFLQTESYPFSREIQSSAKSENIF